MLQRPALLNVILCVLLLSGAPSIRADDDPFEGKLLPMELVMEFRQQIDLTRDQQKAMGRMVVELQKAVADHQWQMQSAYFDLIDIVDAIPIDEKQAVSLMRQAMEAENNIKVEQVSFMIRLRNLLDEKQIKYLQQQVAKGWQAP